MVVGEKVSVTKGVAVALEVGVKVPAPAPEEGEVEGVEAGRVEEGLLEDEAALAGLPVGVPVEVEERDSVRVALGDLEGKEVGELLPPPPLPVTVVVG